ncbi:MAG: MFS transporter, partial [Alicyclobacillus sp.]|nr:MFS transporter [Alicyclobacillus sp.]
PYFFAQVMHLPANQAGFYLVAVPVWMIVLSPLAGTIADKRGSRLPTAAGMSSILLGSVLLGSVPAAAPVVWVLAALVLVGCGLGLFIAPNNSAILNGTPASVQGVTSGVIATGRYTGFLLGISLAGTGFTWLQHGAFGWGGLAYLQAFHVVMGCTAVVALLGLMASWRAGRAGRPTVATSSPSASP